MTVGEGGDSGRFITSPFHLPWGAEVTGFCAADVRQQGVGM